jgi:hypothetical protein
MLIFQPAPGYRLAKSEKCWWRSFRARADAIVAKRELLARGIADFKCIIKDGKAKLPRQYLGPASKKVPAFEILDPETDPKRTMITAFRKLQFAIYAQEFSAAAPQRQREQPPAPLNPPLPLGRQPRSQSEELEMSLRKRGIIS